ncbi:hypothetical protein [Janthinobacterium sp. 17J80-10]|uniref:hypothetical protein n=1 Tax=Janthinobacterium sp. 17J80-10 TaxID=2497863 RepID=UPI0019D6D39B|nr:hypothetical protein [Janthinobacterium sp. 17J80-10]
MKTRTFATITMLTASSFLVGCASIVNGTSQVVSVETRHNGQQVVGANCSMVNPKGTFYVSTPGTVTINRAYDDLSVKCEKEGMKPGLATVKSSTKPMAFGNIIFGGLIGAAVDAGSGAAYDYPTLISVIMEQTITQALPVAGQPASAQPVASASTADNFANSAPQAAPAAAVAQK